MPLWPFHRKKRRESAYVPVTTDQPPMSEPTPTTPINVDTSHANMIPHPTDPLSANAASIQSRESQRKRRRSPETPLESLFTKDSMATAHFNTATQHDYRASHGPYHPSQVPMPDLHHHHHHHLPYTEIPHLERTVRPASRQLSAPAPRRKRLSKRQDVADRAIRDGQIRALSALSSHDSYRHSTHGDIVRRDSKRGSRSAAKSRADKRDSTASLPVPGSIRSDMSGVSEPNGWEVSSLNFLNPRPSVRYSGVMHHSASLPNVMGTQRPGQTPDKLPVLNEHISKRSRNKISDLADDFDASDIRMLMERDRRRREKKKTADFDKLDESLRRIRADKERAELASEPVEYSGPTAVHPAFRDHVETDANIGQAPLSPVSLHNGPRGSPHLMIKEEVPEQDPFRDAVQSQSEHEMVAAPVTPIMPALQQASPLPSPGETPFATPGEEAVIGEAEAVTFSHAQVHHGAMSPPMSPTRVSRMEKQSPLRRELEPTPISTAPAPTKESRRLGSTWSQIFRRSVVKNVDNRASTSDMSFSNTSRESMSRQQLPAHLVATQIAPKRDSAAPTRKQSIFREELADSPTTSPKAKSTDAGVATVSPALTRRQKLSTLSVTPEAPVELSSSRTESPIDVAMTNSLASIDSEGSWLTGRPSVRKSVHSQLRNSTGSLNRRKSEAYNGSYEDLGMSEEEYMRQSTFGSPRTDATSVLGDLPDRSEFGDDINEDEMVKRRDTNRKTPTLVHRDPQYKSREGLVADYLAGSNTPGMDGSRPGTAMSGTFVDEGGEGDGFDVVEYGRGHARKLSTGSAKLLDTSRSGSRSRSGIGGKRVSSDGSRGFVRPKSMPPL